MIFPPDFVLDSQAVKVYRLKRVLKQPSGAWFDRFSQAMVRFGYKRCQLNHTLFIKRSGEHVTILIVYLDDNVLTGSSEKEIQVLKKCLSKEFEIKDLGESNIFFA